MQAALRYVKLSLLVSLLCLGIAPHASAQFEDDEWQETPFQEALRQGSQAFDAWKLEDAERFFRKALTHVDEEPEDQQIYASAYARVYLSRVLDAMQREEDALEMHELAMEALLQPDTYLDDEDRADVYREHAGLLMQLGEWDAAEEHIDKSYEHAKEWYGEDNPWALWYLSDKAPLLMQTQRQDESIELHERIIEINDEHYGANNPGASSALGSAAYDAAMSGDDERAIEWYERLLAFDQNEYNENSQALYNRYYWLGGLNANVGDYDRALEYLYKALEITETAFGEEHINAASTLASIANVQCAAGDAEAALDSVERALRMIDTGDDAGRRFQIDLLMYQTNLLHMLDRSDDAEAAMDELRKAIHDH